MYNLEYNVNLIKILQFLFEMAEINCVNSFTYTSHFRYTTFASSLVHPYYFQRNDNISSFCRLM